MGVVNYFADNVPLFCICAIVLFLAIRNLRLRKKESTLLMVFTGIVLILSVIVFMERFSRYYGYQKMATVFTSLGYVTRPILLYVFILLTNIEQKTSRKVYLLLAIPLLLAIVVYSFPLFFGVDGLAKIVFYYEINNEGIAVFHRGILFLNFTSHIICAGYLLWLVYLSTVRFYGKHRRDGLVIVLCVGIILITVAVEMLADRNDLLNIVCEICAIANYIFMMSINTSKDPLTNIYDRRTYYDDISKYRHLVNGIVQIDMNGLKFLNDNYGHTAGDQALAAIAKIFEDSIDKAKMCVYRLSGDEFLILMFEGKKEILDKTVEMIKEKIAGSKYAVAIGSYYYDKTDDITYEEAMKKAEELMYQDKNAYYAIPGHNRRKQ